MMAIQDWLINASNWLQEGDRSNLIFTGLALALLVELSFRVIRRAVNDRRAVKSAAQNNHRVNVRLGRAPSA